jgi:hypothetical protein
MDMEKTFRWIYRLLEHNEKQNKETMMKSKILMAVGVAGMFIGNPAVDALAEVNVRIGSAPRHAIVIDRPPSFIQLGTPGFSVSYGSPYDIVLYGNSYYLYNDGLWYRSSRYNGPWGVIHENSLPPRIRRYRINDIRRFRDVEYRRHQERYDRERSGNDRNGRWERRDDRPVPDHRDDGRRDDRRP